MGYMELWVQMCGIWISYENEYGYEYKNGEGNMNMIYIYIYIYMHSHLFWILNQKMKWNEEMKGGTNTKSTNTTKTI